MNDWFKTYRKIYDNSIWKNISEFRLFLWIFGKAVYGKEINYGNVTVKRGQYLRSIRKLQEDLEYIENNKVTTPSKGTIERTIKSLVRKGMITTTTTELGTLFTVVNYSKYQPNSIDNEETKNELGTGLGTDLGQQRDNNKKDKNEKNLYLDIFDHWNNQKIRVHRTLGDNLIGKIKTTLKKYNPEEIKTSISNYALILHDDKYYFSYSWTLGDFLQRGIEKFDDLGVAKNNFLIKKPQLNELPKKIIEFRPA